ncbi:MAG: hypothetical protein GW748_06345 [Alphaproteobacteria bacterium]|nr:hypothetical protein [Alphaproteobacteria bacterium]NCQ67346.1 hypothetical protein [Alphaproteobacteria bacterium]NCT06687.1 hypothetical protein [Alphaproteobacteria bacterium]
MAPSFTKTFFALFLLFFTFSPLKSNAQSTNAYTSQKKPYSSASLETHFQHPFCFKTNNKDENAAQKYTKVIQLYKATFKAPKDPESVWDPIYLQKNPHIFEAIQEFETGRRAQTLKQVNLEGKTAQEIHTELLKLGFFQTKLPLRASFKKQTYWLTNGKTTKDPDHKNLVYTHFYTHADGSLVRIKAAGIPDFRGKHPRRSPHAIKAVLLNTDPNLCQRKNCNYDTSYQNEAFKVTNENRPVPKAPSAKCGLKLPPNTGSSLDEQKADVIKNAVMNFAHTNLKTTCPPPQ